MNPRTPFAEAASGPTNDDLTDRSTFNSATAVSVPVDEVIAKLDNIGLSAEMIAHAVNMPTSDIKATLTYRRTILSPEEQELADEVRRLAKETIRQANKIMQFGHFEAKMSIIKSMLSGASRLIGEDSAGSTSEARVALHDLLADMRNVPNPMTEPTSDALAVEASTLPTDHQDKEVGD